MSDLTCAAYDEVTGVCGATPATRYLTGVRCRTCAPGATEEACMHGVPWTDECGRCAGDPPLPSPVPTASEHREPKVYGAAKGDPLHRTINHDDSGKRFADKLPRRPCPTCTRPRAKGHKGDCYTQAAATR